MGTYRLGRRFAIGGMAEVYLATSLGVNGFSKPVAVKRVLPHMAEDATFVEHFMQEARLTESLQHRNIVQVLDLGTQAGEPYMILELVDGENLRSLLKTCARTGQRLSVREAVYITMQVAEGLAHAHASTFPDGRPLGLVHRDINPANVLLSAAGEVKLADFGIARAAEMQSDTQAGVVKGKPGYLSPEQVRGRQAGQTSDVFLLGLLLHELLTGTALFHGLPFFQAIARIRSFHPSQLPRPEGLPDALWPLICHALLPDPSQRLGSARRFANALEEILFAERMRVGSRDLAALLMRVFPERVSLLRDMGLAQGRVLTLDPWSVSLVSGRSEQGEDLALAVAAADAGAEEAIDPAVVEAVADVEAVDAAFGAGAEAAVLHKEDVHAQERADDGGDDAAKAAVEAPVHEEARGEELEHGPGVEREVPGDDGDVRNSSGPDCAPVSTSGPEQEAIAERRIPEAFDVSSCSIDLEGSAFFDLSELADEGDAEGMEGAVDRRPQLEAPIAPPALESTAFLTADDFELVEDELPIDDTRVSAIPAEAGATSRYEFDPAELDALLRAGWFPAGGEAPESPSAEALGAGDDVIIHATDADLADEASPPPLDNASEARLQADAASPGEAWQHLLSATLQALSPHLAVQGPEVATLAVRIAMRLGLGAPEIGEVRLAALTLAVGTGLGGPATPSLHQLKALLGAHWSEASDALEGCGLFGDAVADEGPGLALAAALEVSRTGGTPHEGSDPEATLEAIRREGRLPAWALPALAEALSA